MLLMPGKKKVATIIVAGMSPKKPDFVQKMGEEGDTGEYKVPEGEDESMMGLVSAAESVMKAFKDGNAKNAAKALKNFIYMCEEEGDEGMEGESENGNDYSE